MKIAVHDGDGHGFPNLALMKIAAYHKAIGDDVEWYNALMTYDRVYSSKVFTFTPVDEYLPPDVIRGGTGYGIYEDLPEEIDAMFPDYSIYPKCKHAIGFLTRGCIRNCPWCIVPRKEGRIRPYRTWQEVKRTDSKDIVFMDNNILACDYGIEQMESMAEQDVRVDFNQGLDSRLITPEIADILVRLKWKTMLHTACDTDEVLDTVLAKIELLKERGFRARDISVLVLTTDIGSAERRVIALRDAGASPFAMPYRDYTNNIQPTLEQKMFARWVNRKAIFHSCDTFADYRRSRKHDTK